MIKEARIEALSLEQGRDPARMITTKMLPELEQIVSMASGTGLTLDQMDVLTDAVWDYVLNEVAPQIIEIVQGELVK